ncbi:MAG: hypothetical protein WCO58_00205 [bacterium]
MNILSVIPIAKGIPKDQLSYFSAKEVAPGMLVSVPIRKKNVPALVVSTTNATEEKASLKSAHFNIRKINKVLGYLPFDPFLIDTLISTAPFFVAGPGEAIETFVPTKLLDSLSTIAIKEPKQKKILQEKSEVLLFQSALDERIAHYKILIRQSFARKQSIYFIVPSKADVHFYTQEFSKGIEPYTISYTSDISQKELNTIWKKSTEEHPLLIIGTPSAVCFDRNDTAYIVIEHERSRAYKTLSYPYIDLRLVLEAYARKAHIPCIIGDSLLRTETIAERDNYGHIGQTSLRLPDLSEIKIESLRDENDKFSLISKPLKKALGRVQENNEHLMLFVPRKGLAPITVCNDCGTTVRCTGCDAPLVLYMKGKDNRIYSCNRCGNTEDATKSCTHCTGWNLVPLGIGTETVKEFLSDSCKDVPITILDKDHISSKKDGQKIIEDFYASPCGILIATEYAIPLMRQPIDKIAIVTMDTLFSIPHFRMDESIVGLIIALSERAKAPLLIQTDKIDAKLLSHIKSGNLTGWQREIVDERKMLSYPPFVHLITIRHQGNKVDTQKYKTLIEREFTDYNPYIHTVTLSKVKELYETTVLMKIKRSEWPSLTNAKEDLREFPFYQKVQAFTPAYKVEINPDSIL